MVTARLKSYETKQMNITWLVFNEIKSGQVMERKRLQNNIREVLRLYIRSTWLIGAALESRSVSGCAVARFWRPADCKSNIKTKTVK